MSVATVVTEGFGSFGNIPFIVTEGYGPFDPVPAPTPATSPGSAGRGSKPRSRGYLLPEQFRIPQQVINDVEALYRLIATNRKALDRDTLRAVADLVGFFAENYDGRLPPAEAVHWRDLVEYPNIDLSILRTAADLIIAAPVQPMPKPLGPAPIPNWAVVMQAGAVDRAMERLKRDAASAAAAAAKAEEDDEEEALLALLMVL